MTAPRLVVALACLVVAGCGSQTGASSTTSDLPVTASTTPNTTTTVPVATTITTTTTTERVATTITTTSTIPPPPTVGDGLPATFLAVTEDYEAVEVDTMTGTVVRRIGQRADAASLASGDEIAPNVVDGVWRTASGGTVLVSECCEPAAGRITFLVDDATLDPDYGEPAWNGWWVVPSPNTSEVIITGYSTEVVNAAGDRPSDAVPLFENDGSGVGAIGWSFDGASIHWFDDTATELVTWTRTADGFTMTSRTPIDWIGPDQRLAGIEARASGDLVSFLTRLAPDGDPLETTGVVYSAATGELVAEFPVATGSWFGGYDPSGRFLLYTTPSGVVTYQGQGRVEELGEGYLYASW